MNNAITKCLVLCCHWFYLILLAAMKYVTPVIRTYTSSSGGCSDMTSSPSRSDNSYTGDEEWDICVHPKDHQVRFNRKSRVKRPIRSCPYPLRTPSFSSTSSQYSSTSDGFRNVSNYHWHRRRGQSTTQKRGVDVPTIVLNGHPGYKPCRLPCAKSEALQEHKLPNKQNSPLCYNKHTNRQRASSTSSAQTENPSIITTSRSRRSSIDVTMPPPGTIRWTSETRTKLLPGIT